jgi:hypothetical protein
MGLLKGTVTAMPVTKLARGTAIDGKAAAADPHLTIAERTARGKASEIFLGWLPVDCHVTPAAASSETGRARPRSSRWMSAWRSTVSPMSKRRILASDTRRSSRPMPAPNPVLVR